MSFSNLDAACLERHMRAARRTISAIPQIDVNNFTEAEAVFFESSLSEAKEMWSRFKLLWEAREELAVKTGDDDPFPNESWNHYYSSLMQDMTRANGTLLLIRKRESRSASQFYTDASVSNCTAAPAIKPQLPRIPIPTFTGNLLRWKHFKDTFTSLIHNEPTLSDIEKFHYLIGALSGEAASLIAKFPVEDSTYEQAWRKVVETYDNPRLLASLLLQRILECDTRHARSEAQRYDAFLTGAADSIDAFKALKLKDPAEFILATLALRALDPDTRRRYEMSIQDSSIDTLTTDSVINFVRQRSTALKMTAQASSSSATTRGSPDHRLRKNLRSANKQGALSFHTQSSNRNFSTSPPRRNSSQSPSSRRITRKCFLCSYNHALYRCCEFYNLPVNKRLQIVRKHKLCQNCLGENHLSPVCKLQSRCRICKKAHHTLIHEHAKVTSDTSSSSAESQPKPTITLSGFNSPSTSKETPNQMVLLGTVRALIKGNNGDWHPVRALLDSGSQNSFITSSLAYTLGTSVQEYSGSIKGLADSAISKKHLKGITSCRLRSYTSDTSELEVSPVLVDCITNSLPTCPLPASTIRKLSSKALADRHFGTPGPIDLLIGGDIFMEVIRGVPRLHLLPTMFGLVVSGITQIATTSYSCSFFALSERSLETQLKRFWEIEEPKPANRSDPNDIACEEHFLSTHTRQSDGRYVVRLPFKCTIPNLDDNRREATRRYFSLENRFKKQPALALSYREFMKEYFRLGHLSPASSPASYLIPHHGVWQGGPGSSKLRVVFDASSPSSSSSLNHLLHSGAKLQEDLCTILVRFRLYPIVICADLVKMYRQILVHEEDRRFQHILWRDDPSSKLEELELNTVTYGLRSSAFQAMRVIKQLVEDEGSAFPLASPRILRDMYVDDIVTGVNTEEEARRLIAELSGLFAKGGFTLGKWASNIPYLTPGSDGAMQTFSYQHPEDTCVKILGLSWNPHSDALFYVVNRPPPSPITKRMMLSVVARTFDPLGLLSPVTFVAKTIIQEIWKAELDWDTPLSGELAGSWNALASNWHLLAEINVPRLVTSPDSDLLLIGFSDASTRGYAAAVYLRSENAVGEVTVSLIKARSKVSPIKFHSIPRLELCGALLLARLLSSIPLPGVDVICFTDSTTVLSWLSSQPHKLNVYEANRVSQILQLTPRESWQHVKSEDNPADAASRGCDPAALQQNSLWWAGPQWLLQPISAWSKPENNQMVFSSFSAKCASSPFDWTTRFSSYTTLIRVVARIRRLIKPQATRSSTLTPSQRSCSQDTLTAYECSEAELKCVYFTQRLHFPPSIFKDPLIVPKDLP